MNNSGWRGGMRMRLFLKTLSVVFLIVAANACEKGKVSLKFPPGNP